MIVSPSLNPYGWSALRFKALLTHFLRASVPPRRKKGLQGAVAAGDGALVDAGCVAVADLAVRRSQLGYLRRLLLISPLGDANAIRVATMTFCSRTALAASGTTVLGSHGTGTLGIPLVASRA